MTNKARARVGLMETISTLLLIGAISVELVHDGEQYRVRYEVPNTAAVTMALVSHLFSIGVPVQDVVASFKKGSQGKT